MDSSGTPLSTTTPVGRIDFIRGPEASLQFAELLRTCFSLAPGQDFLADFPVWSVDEESGALRIGVFTNEGLVASACARVAHLRIATGVLPVCIIGGVATHPNARGLGYASKLVSICNEWATEHGAAASLLWGSEFDLYHRLGFDLCGSQIQLPIAGIGAAAGAIEQGWNPAIFHQQVARREGLVIEPGDQRWYTAHKNVLWFWNGPKDHPTAYVGLGRGIDLQGIIHEWGGEPSALRELLAGVAKVHPEATILGSRELFRRHGILFDDAASQYLCLAKVLDPQRLVMSYHPTVKVESTRWPASNGDATWEIQIGDRTTYLKDTDLPKFFFGPERNIPGFDLYLPLPLWVWGLDAA
ncbi:MAG: GNAT family N-acetyltransferase [Bacteriovoracia bacterium]